MVPDDLRRAHELVLVGPRGWEYEEITARAGGDIRILGHVPDVELAALYELCTVFCYPSLYEGFGLPLLEAMQSGAASIASNTSSLPEVGGDAVRYVDPYDTRQLAGELESLLGDAGARSDLGRRARERAQTFSWSRTADHIVGALTAIAREGSGA
jgi:alpha-1,3-rhamnosyl/mannosyltransferase